MTAPAPGYARGLALSAGGMIVLSPDGLLIRLLRDADTLQVAFYRQLFLGIALTLVLAALYRERFPAVVRGMGGYGALSALLLAGATFLFVTAIMTTTVANVLILFATIPMWSAVLGRVLIRERVAPRTWAAIALAFTGILVLVGGSFTGGALTGDLLALGMAFLNGLNLVVLRAAGDRDMTPALAGSGLVGALGVLPFAATIPAAGLAVTGHDFLILSVLNLGIQPLGWALFLMGARYAPAAEVGLIGLLWTTLGPLWVWMGVGEAPGTAALAGGALVVAAVALNTALGVRARRHAAGV